VAERQEKRGCAGPEGRNTDRQMQDTLLAVEQPHGMPWVGPLVARVVEGAGDRDNAPDPSLMPAAEGCRGPHLRLHDQQGDEEHAVRNTPGQLHDPDYRSSGLQGQAESIKGRRPNRRSG